MNKRVSYFAGTFPDEMILPFEVEGVPIDLNSSPERPEGEHWRKAAVLIQFPGLSSQLSGLSLAQSSRF